MFTLALLADLHGYLPAVRERADAIVIAGDNRPGVGARRQALRRELPFAMSYKPTGY